MYDEIDNIISKLTKGIIEEEERLIVKRMFDMGIDYELEGFKNLFVKYEGVFKTYYYDNGVEDVFKIISFEKEVIYRKDKDAYIVECRVKYS